MHINNLKIITLSILALSTLIRAYTTLNTELWLDEVWSIEAINLLKNPFNIYFSKNLDGHSGLYSFYIYLSNFLKIDFLYRFLSFSLSILLPLLILLISIKKKSYVYFIAFLLVSFSKLHITYGSEARGYTPMLFFTLLSFLTFRKEIFNKSENQNLISFNVFSILAFLFHYTFLQVYFAFLILSFYKNFKNKFNYFNFIKFNIISLSFFSFFYFFIIKNTPEGSGNIRNYFEVVINVALNNIGLNSIWPDSSIEYGVIALFITLILFLIIIFEIIITFFKDTSLALFYLFSIFIFPTLMVLVLEPKILHARYFYCSSIFISLILASFLVRMWRASNFGKALSSTLLLSFFYLNVNVVNINKGNYNLLLNDLKNLSKTKGIELLVDNKFRHLKMISYYNKDNDFKVNVEKNFKDTSKYILLHCESPFYKADSYINSFKIDKSCHKELNKSMANNTNYKLIKSYPHNGYIGFSLFLYEKI